MPLVRCSQEFHKWVMEKASDGNPVSVVLDRMMVREKEEPGERPDERPKFEERLKKIDELDRVVDVVVKELGECKEELEGLGDRVKKLEGGEREEGEEGVDRVDQVDQDSFICDCGERVAVEENTEESLLDGIEWVICPECNSRRRKEYLEKKGGEK